MPARPPRRSQKAIRNQITVAQRRTRRELQVVRLGYGSAFEIYLASGAITGAVATPLLAAMYVARSFAQTKTTLARERFLQGAYDSLSEALPQDVRENAPIRSVAETLAAIEKVQLIQEPPDSGVPALPPGAGAP